MFSLMLHSIPLLTKEIKSFNNGLYNDDVSMQGRFIQVTKNKFQSSNFLDLKIFKQDFLVPKSI